MPCDGDHQHEDQSEGCRGASAETREAPAVAVRSACGESGARQPMCRAEVALPCVCLLLQDRVCGPSTKLFTCL
jgi:hypothetical protein